MEKRGWMEGGRENMDGREGRNRDRRERGIGKGERGVYRLSSSISTVTV